MVTFLGFLIAFAVKIPMFPVHTWLILQIAHVGSASRGLGYVGRDSIKDGWLWLLTLYLAHCTRCRTMHFFANGMIGLSLIAIIYIKR